ncbi:unnamed protein product, partial [Closterium sp. Naga37s-1]
MDQHGNVLLFNGEIFGGLPVLQPEQNDARCLLSALSSCCSCRCPSPQTLNTTSGAASLKSGHDNPSTTSSKDHISSASSGSSNIPSTPVSFSQSSSSSPPSTHPDPPPSPLSARPALPCPHPHSVPRLLSSLRGPFALAYWQATAGTLWLARDFMGRRSLLLHGPCWEGSGKAKRGEEKEGREENERREEKEGGEESERGEEESGVRSTFVVSSVCPSPCTPRLSSAERAGSEARTGEGALERAERTGGGRVERGGESARNWAGERGAEIGERGIGAEAGEGGEVGGGRRGNGGGEAIDQSGLSSESTQNSAGGARGRERGGGGGEAVDQSGLPEFRYWQELPCGIYSTVLPSHGEGVSEGLRESEGVSEGSREREGVKVREDEWEWFRHEWEDETVQRLLTWQRPMAADVAIQGDELAGGSAEVAHPGTELAAAGDAADSAADDVLAALDRAVGIRVMHIREERHIGKGIPIGPLDGHGATAAPVGACVRREEEAAPLAEPEAAAEVAAVAGDACREEERAAAVAPEAAAAGHACREREEQVAPVAVLFSGGLDSMLLAALAHRHVPIHRECVCMHRGDAGGTSSGDVLRRVGLRDVLRGCMLLAALAHRHVPIH